MTLTGDLTMLINSLDSITSEDTSILNKLDAISLKLYLTGSRYFNQFSRFPITLSNNTDYDYFCKYSDLNVQKLKEWFPQGKYVPASTLNKEIGQYNDSNIIGVFFLQDKATKVDIQLVKHLDLKIEVQKILAAMGDRYISATKSQKQWLWNQQYLRICKERNIVQ